MLFLRVRIHIEKNPALNVRIALSSEAVESTRRCSDKTSLKIVTRIFTFGEIRNRSARGGRCLSRGRHRRSLWLRVVTNATISTSCATCSAARRVEPPSRTRCGARGQRRASIRTRDRVSARAASRLPRRCPFPSLPASLPTR